MNARVDFRWPKDLESVRRAAEEGALAPRELYPVEVKALCSLVVDVPLDNGPREIAPGTSVMKRVESKDDAGYTQRASYYFITRFANGRVWQCSLFTDWLWNDRTSRKKLSSLKPQYIAQGLTRIAPEASQR